MTSKPTAEQILRRRALLVAGIALALILPCLAMHVTDEVRWTPADFGFAASLLGLAAFGFEVAVAGVSSRRQRLLVGAMVATLTAAVWLQGAVGLL